ncbi:uncharacterized protein PG998_000354 [Apiospora kogelbergensis]|uniref:uncharacterized protein n=1 Tax=Apiospora kogelbergensis TaxID=1337665 RepID=UPI00312D71C9
MHASLPAQPILAERESFVNLWREFSNTGKIARRDYERARSGRVYDVESTDGQTKTPLTHPKEYLDVIARTIIPELAIISPEQSVHKPWVVLVRQSYAELLRQLFEGSDGRQWVDPVIRPPPFELDDRLSSFPDIWPRVQPARPGVYTDGFSPDERFLTTSQIAQESLLLVKTATSQGWSCYEVPDDIDIRVVSNASRPTLYGPALQDDNNPFAKQLRPRLREQGPVGILMPWYLQREVGSS